MGTLAVVAKKENNTFKYITVHFDGYIEGGVGEKLYTCYTTEEKVDRLLEAGNLSKLECTIESSVAYDEQAGIASSIKDLGRCLPDYIYVFWNNAWHVTHGTNDGHFEEFEELKNYFPGPEPKYNLEKLLKNVLDKLDEVNAAIEKQKVDMCTFNYSQDELLQIKKTLLENLLK